MPGHLIAFEALDGAGKATQLDMLYRYFRDRNIPVYPFSFPDYNTPIGGVIEEYLHSERLPDLNPFALGSLFALDRFNKLDWINAGLSKGMYILLDRWVDSNKAYGFARHDYLPLSDWMRWVDEYEHDALLIPPAEVTIFLDIPVEVSMRRTKARAEQDENEKDAAFLSRVAQTYREIAASNRSYEWIRCIDADGRERTEQEIHEEIVVALKRRGIV